MYAGLIDLSQRAIGYLDHVVEGPVRYMAAKAPPPLGVAVVAATSHRPAAGGPSLAVDSSQPTDHRPLAAIVALLDHRPTVVVFFSI